MDARQLLSRLTASPGATGLAGGVLGGGLVAALGSKKGRKALGTAAQVGGLAALGGLAYHAWNRYQQSQQHQGSGAQAGAGGISGAASAGAGMTEAVSVAGGTAATTSASVGLAGTVSGGAVAGSSAVGGAVTALPPASDAVRQRFMPGDDQADEQQRLSRNLLQAMVAAAKADGAIDEAEWRRIDGRVAELGLDETERGFLMDCMREAAEPARVARLARNPEEAAELYLASLLAIDADHWTEQAYLDQLRRQLGIAPGLAAELERAAA